ncbi:MAG: hypothetical protein QM500_05095 [Methylococcales bacterium]
MIKLYRPIPLLFLLSLLVLTGCAGLKSFNHTARAGDTIAIAAGWKHQFSRDQLTVTFTPSSGNDVVYLPNNPGVSASINLYADPASYMAVGYEIGENSQAYNFASTYGTVVSSYTDNSPDWWETVVFVKLPDTLPEGTANVSLVSSGSLGESWSVPIKIIAGTGSPHLFEAQSLPNGMQNEQRHTLERAPNFEVHFTGATSPHAIQIDLIHDMGVGTPYIVNPRGDVKSVNWTDDGQNLRVLLNFTHENPLRTNIGRFKFYVSGGVTGLQVQDVQAFDVNGAPVVGVVADIVNHF